MIQALFALCHCRFCRCFPCLAALASRAQPCIDSEGALNYINLLWMHAVMMWYC